MSHEDTFTEASERCFVNEIGGNDPAADYTGRSKDSQSNHTTDVHRWVCMERIILMFFPLSC